MYTFMEGTYSSDSEGTEKKIVQISVDTASEIPEPETDWGCGSSCLIVDTQDVKFLNSQGVWV